MLVAVNPQGFKIECITNRTSEYEAQDVGVVRKTSPILDATSKPRAYAAITILCARTRVTNRHQAILPLPSKDVSMAEQ